MTDMSPPNSPQSHDAAHAQEVAVGQVWRSLDPRDIARGRTVEIEDFDRDFVRVVSYFGDDTVVRKGRRSRIHRSRFDGVQFKKARRGEH